MKCYGAGGDGKSCSTQGFLQGQICSIRATMLPAQLPPVGYAPRASFGQYWLHLPSPGINSKKRGWSWGLLYHPAHTVCTLVVPVETFSMMSSPLPSLVSGRFWCAVTSSSRCRNVVVSQMCTPGLGRANLCRSYVCSLHVLPLLPQTPHKPWGCLSLHKQKKTRRFGLGCWWCKGHRLSPVL